MIIQMFLDMLAELLTIPIQAIPPLPADATAAIGNAESSAIALGGLVSKFGAVIPWDVIMGCVQIWIGLLVFWVAVLAIRFVLWAFSR